jgi:drug/metabolite transporter (DMT)-like permease
MTWTLLQIGATLLMSANAILDKHLVDRHRVGPILYLLSFVVVGLPVAIIGICLTPWPSPSVILVGLTSGLLFSLVILLYYWAMSLDDVSRLAPILRLSSGLKLVLLAILLDDRLTTMQYLSFALTLIGTLALAWRSPTIRANPKGRLGHGLVIMSVVACLLAFNGVLDGYLNVRYSPLIYLIWSNLGTTLGMGLALLFRSQREAVRQAWTSLPRRFWVMTIGEQIGRLMVGLLSGYAAWEAKSVAMLLLFEGLRPALILLLSWIFIGEELCRRELFPRLLGLIGLLLGTILLMF